MKLLFSLVCSMIIIDNYVTKASACAMRTSSDDAYYYALVSL